MGEGVEEKGRGEEKSVKKGDNFSLNIYIYKRTYKIKSILNLKRLVFFGVNINTGLLYFFFIKNKTMF